METIILAGGLGTRLRSVVNDIPKCMAPIDGKPLLWYWLKYLENNQIDNVVLALGYLSDTIISWISEIKSQFSCKISYTIETQPLGTGGAIRLALKETSSDEVLIVNGDSFFAISLQDYFQKYYRNPTTISLALKKMQNFSRYGNVKLDSNGTIISFEEKRYCKEGLINTGIYIVKPKELNLDNYQQKFSFENEILQNRNDISGFVFEDYFIDIGIPEDYFKAQKDLPKIFQAYLHK